MRKIQIMAVNKPNGTMTVLWDDDPGMEWNYNIPLDAKGRPLFGDDLLRWLVAEAYDSVKFVLKQREEKVRREAADFSAFDSLRRARIDVSDKVVEFEELRRAEAAVGSPPRSRV